MIFLTGPHGAGKTIIAKLLEGHRFAYLDLGGILREIHQLEDSKTSFKDWCRKNEAEHGSCFTDAVLVEEILKRRAEFMLALPPLQDLVIVGSRSPRGVKYITDRVPLVGSRKNIIIYIDAPIEMLLKRYAAREGKILNMEQFSKILDADDEIGFSGMKSFADISVINDGTEEELVKKISKIIFADLGYFP